MKIQSYLTSIKVAAKALEDGSNLAEFPADIARRITRNIERIEDKLKIHEQRPAAWRVSFTEYAGPVETDSLDSALDAIAEALKDGVPEKDILLQKIVRVPFRAITYTAVESVKVHEEPL
jgi:hypothetical protein